MRTRNHGAQQAKDKVEVYVTGVLSDSIADVQYKKLLDEKVGSLLGIKTTQVAREGEIVEQHRNRIHRIMILCPPNPIWVISY